jgi:Tol biopolymer transport system component
MQLFAMDADGRNPRRLTSDDQNNVDPAWSWDQTRVAFVRAPRGGTESQGPAESGSLPLSEAPSPWEIVVLDLATQEQRVVAQGDGWPRPRPVWSPDGSELAYVSSAASGPPDIYVVAADGGAPRPLQWTTTTWELFLDWR